MNVKAPDLQERTRSNITRWFTGIFFVMSIAPSASLAQPKIVVDKTEIDLGTIYNGDNKSAKIVLKNGGKDTLRIMAIQPSCGCTTVKEPKQALGPGESDVAEVAFNSTGYRGGVIKHFVVVSNDPRSPNLTIALKADVREELEPVTHSSVVWLGTIPVGKEFQQSFTFRNISQHAITIKRTTFSSPIIRARPVKETVVPSDTLRLQLTITPDKDGYFNGELILETDSKNQTRVPVRVTFIGIKPS